LLNSALASFINQSCVGLCMGRIKTQQIKRLTFQIVREYRDELKTVFAENKPVVASHLSRPNKRVRNAVAGYVTRLMKTKDALS